MRRHRQRPSENTVSPQSNPFSDGLIPIPTAARNQKNAVIPAQAGILVGIRYFKKNKDLLGFRQDSRLRGNDGGRKGWGGKLVGQVLMPDVFEMCRFSGINA
ncbi:hypothetical protein HMPREF9123_2879 [Neisseria bacilliformis ATCC BAA-1200]|uniref:Uncharacterized protein n=1 Tax=Neisseria bacilliformis ATCC BAA-1200 TaxID=888742 RepID=F2BGM2_9NEIS|nr:hypothetical protein HMPREF9123_2879 [Neisseria bacilliformis ATCC BAA-1200]